MNWSNAAESWILFSDPMNSLELIVNGKRQDVAVSPDTPLLWVLRDKLGLTGAKYGCGRRAAHSRRPDRDRVGLRAGYQSE